MNSRAASEGVTLIKVGQLWTGETDAPIPDATLVIRGGVIEEIRTGKALTERSSQVIDAPAATALPGLIDSHVHLSIPFSPYDAEGQQASTTDETLGRAAFFGVRNARQILERGVTTVRDLGSHGYSVFALQRSIDRGELPGPRVVAAGPAISPTGGHFPIGSVVADGPEAIQRTARQHIAAGARVIKVMASAGGVTPGRGAYTVLLSSPEIEAAAKQAHARGATVAAHAVNPEAASNAIIAGVDSIEHGVLIDVDTLALMLEHGTFFVPTLWVYRRTARFGERFRSLGAAQLDELRSRLRNHREAVKHAQEMGIPIAAGSDAGTPAMPADALTWELEWLVSCGLRPVDALRAATGNAAKLLGLEQEAGRLSPGMPADLLIVNGNPLVEVAELRSVHSVLKNGHIVVINGETRLGHGITDPHPFPDGPYPGPADADAG